VGDGTSYCEDDPRDRNSPVHVEDWRDMSLPPDIPTDAIVNQTGQVWQHWGWQVVERDGFPKPNRFGYAPDGYVFGIVARADLKQPPGMIGTSPCFAGNLRDSTSTKPLLIEQQPTR
jgi:hypothetical protein